MLWVLRLLYSTLSCLSFALLMKCTTSQRSWGLWRWGCVFYIQSNVWTISLSLSLFQVSSPQLFSKEVLEENLPSRLQNLYQLGPSTSHAQPATPTSSPATAGAGGKSSDQSSSTGVGAGGTVLNIPQQLLQKLLASASQVSYRDNYTLCMQSSVITPQSCLYVIVQGLP